MAVNKKATLKKKKITRAVPHARVYIQSSFNNTIISITDATGNVLSWSSSGHNSFKGARKATPYAAQTTLKTALDKAVDYGIQTVDVFVSGVGSGREAAVRGFKNMNIAVSSIKDITPIPHNGCRPKKPRRV